MLQANGKIVGYSALMRDDENSVILKTLAILPEYQGLGLANALIYKMHEDVIKSGCIKVIYALIREENRVRDLPQNDVTIFRRYASFESQVN